MVDETSHLANSLWLLRNKDGKHGLQPCAMRRLRPPQVPDRNPQKPACPLGLMIGSVQIGRRYEEH